MHALVNVQTYLPPTAVLFQLTVTENETRNNCKETSSLWSPALYCMPLTIRSPLYVPLDTKQVISETFSQPISWLSTEETKPNAIKSKHHKTKWQKCTKSKRKKKAWSKYCNRYRMLGVIIEQH